MTAEPITKAGWAMLGRLLSGGISQPDGSDMRVAAPLIRAGHAEVIEGRHSFRRVLKITDAGREFVLAGLSDSDRLRLAERPGRGPVEWTECTHHRGRYEGYRWFWDGDSPDQREAVENSDCEFVRGCEACEDEEES